jgi:multiple antibiotic resistance protein
MDLFWLAFLPLFVAFDAVGLLPVYWGLAHRLSAERRRRAVSEAVITAGIVALSFLLVSGLIFGLMGLTVSDVMIAGGVILIVLCLRELLLPEKPADADASSPGIVPLGVPLLSGPAVMTTVLLVRDHYGWPITIAALGANLFVIWAILAAADKLMGLLGREGSQVVSKISSLILTAFGVMLIRHGLMMAHITIGATAK